MHLVAKVSCPSFCPSLPSWLELVIQWPYAWTIQREMVRVTEKSLVQVGELVVKASMAKVVTKVYQNVVTMGKVHFLYPWH